MIDRTIKRFQEMKELHSKYFPFYREHLLSAKKRVKDKLIQRMLNDFVVNKIGFRPGIRAYIFRTMWKLLELKENDTLFHLCASIEMQLGQTYSYNVGADNKAGYSGDNKKVAFETANQMLNIHKDFVYKIPQLDLSQKKAIWNIFEKIYKVFYTGQVFDTLINLYPNLNKPINDILKSTDDKNFSDKFGFHFSYKNRVASLLKREIINLITLENFLWQRTYGINANMIECYPYIIRVINPRITKEKILNLSRYGRYYGLAMMIINDIQDFSLDLVGEKYPTREKKKEDVFNDVKNKKITWPILYGLKSWNYEAIRKIEKIYKDPKNVIIQEDFREYLVKSGLIERTLLEATTYASISTDFLKTFSKNDHRENLEDISISICKNSKYVKSLSERYKTKIKIRESQVKARKEILKQYLQNNSKLLLRPFKKFLIINNEQIL